MVWYLTKWFPSFKYDLNIFENQRRQPQCQDQSFDSLSRRKWSENRKYFANLGKTLPINETNSCFFSYYQN